MPDVFGLEISNLDSLRLKAGLMHESIRKNVEKELYKQGVVIQTRAKTILRTVHWQTKGGITRRTKGGKGRRYEPGATLVGHIDTATLHRDINTKATARPSLLEVRIGTSNVAPYAIYVEMLPDGGFLRPAFKESVKDAQLALQKKIKETIAFVAKKKL